jgi:ATP-dependent Clp protease ATP-binding subunit ClpA
VTDSAVSEAVKRIFAPEFRNRLDGVVLFNGLDKAVVVDIVKKQIREFQDQLAEKKVALHVTERVYEWLADQGHSEEFGARQIARLVQDRIKNFFVDEVLFGGLVCGGIVNADIGDDGIVLKVTSL